MADNKGMRFHWDPEKEQANTEKHGISFPEAAAFLSSSEEYLEIYDVSHSHEEDRFIAIGPLAGRIIVVVYTERPEDAVRVISARPATKREIQLYQEYRG